MSAQAQSDDLTDNWDDLLESFEGVVVEGGADAAAEDDNCEGGACKI